ncbi:MAG: carboxypeptidase regulatory-like domain-containing protein [Acidobacteria bacterium]|nr:carboxypeptidase regulatory-like domain-containing protein [Acidobacteriota bacterium]
MQKPLRSLTFPLTVAMHFVSLAGLAQTTATLVGDVFDPSGNYIPGAAVTVISEGTGYARTVATNMAGQYRVTPLNPGTYNIEVKAQGFKSQLRNGVVLQVSAVLEVDFTMALGAVTETVEVAGAAPVLQTEEASVGNVVAAKDLERLPVNGRNYTRLILLMPGTSSVTRSQSQGTAQSGTSLFSVNGGRPQDNNFTLDGFDSNFQMMNSPGISPPMDAMQEFKIATNTGSEFGRSMGANVSMVIKSGTSKIHGTVYEYLRNNVFDANEFFANRSSLPKVPFKLNQYGASIGGPIPKLARGKMFWFASWEGFRSRRSSTQIGSVPIADFRAGDFSALLGGASRTVITNPFSSNAPYPNNVIPASQINKAIPTALELTTPLPNRAGLTQNYIASGSQGINRDGLHWRYDYNINEKNSFYFRYSYQNADLLSPQLQPIFKSRSEFDVVNFGASWIHIFSPTTTLEVGFGTNQPISPGITDKGSLTRADYLAKTGMQMYQKDVFGDPLVNISIGSYSIPGVGGQVIGDNIWQWRGNVTKIVGKHSFKFGGQYHHRQFFTNGSNPMNGDALFLGGVTGFPMADALLGYPGEVRRGEGNTLTDGIGHFVLAHVQDDWRVTKKLTINLGLMYQFGSRPYDSTDRLGNLYVQRDPQTGVYSGRLLWATTNPQPNPDTGQANSPARTDGFGRALIRSDKNDWAPRLGIAYKVNDKTVVRTGVGMFYNSTFVQELQDLRKFWPFTVQQVFSPNRGGVLDQSISAPGPAFSNTSAIGGWPQNPDNRSPYSTQWNLFVQRQLQDDLSFEIGYVGSASRKQIGYSPFNNALTPGPGAIQPRRLLTNFGDLDGGSNQFSGSYNGLQTSLKKRFSRGSQFNLNYTWQKSLDNQSSLAENQKTQDPFNRRPDWSRSSWDINHVLVFSYVYELPFGRNRRFGGNMSRAAELIAGGWSLEGISRFESGPPFMVFTSEDIANTGRKTQRLNYVAGNPNPNAGPKTAEQWFNTGAFVRPQQYSFGNVSPYVTNADGIIGMDVVLQKEFRIREGHGLELRCEFYNFPNTTSFGDPQGNINTGSAFGTVTSQRVSSRQIQFSLRYRF